VANAEIYVTDTTTAKLGDYYQHERVELLNFIPPTVKTVLDVGCGQAGFGSVVKARYSAEVWGIELNGDAARKAAGRLDRVMKGDIAKCVPKLPNNYFDCVIFNDVLEHLADPFTVLDQIKKKLCKDGVVVCSIPNIRYFRVLYDLVVRKRWTYRESGVLDVTHLRFFTAKSIEAMFESLNYEVVQLKGINQTQNIGVRLIGLLSLGWLSDTTYLQFGCIVRPRR